MNTVRDCLAAAMLIGFFLAVLIASVAVDFIWPITVLLVVWFIFR